MPIDHTEKAFEAAIEDFLLGAGGYAPGDRDGYDLDRALFPGEVIAFVRTTQPDEWGYLETARF